MNQRIIDDISKFVFVSNELKSADIIFIPGGSHPELGESAANLYQMGWASKVMPSGGVSVKTGKFAGVKSKREIYNKSYASDCEFLFDVLRINGVLEKDIICENTSGSTKENAYFSRIVLDEKQIQIKKAIICCKGFHARRSLMFYQFAFPDVDFYIHSVPYVENEVEISIKNWYKTDIGVQRVLGELQRYGNQFNEEFLSLADNIKGGERPCQ